MLLVELIRTYQKIEDLNLNLLIKFNHMVILTKEPYYGWILIIYKTYKFNLGILKKKKKKKPTCNKLSFLE